MKPVMQETGGKADSFSQDKLTPTNEFLPSAKSINKHKKHRFMKKSVKKSLKRFNVKEIE